VVLGIMKENVQRNVNIVWVPILKTALPVAVMLSGTIANNATACPTGAVTTAKPRSIVDHVTPNV